MSHANPGKRTYDHAIREFVAWYCSEPRLAFNRTVVLRHRIHLEQRPYAPATINLRLGTWLTPEQGRRLLERPQPATPRELRDIGPPRADGHTPSAP